jgi:hypothetical protein
MLEIQLSHQQVFIENRTRMQALGSVLHHSLQCMVKRKYSSTTNAGRAEQAAPLLISNSTFCTGWLYQQPYYYSPTGMH